MQLYTVYFIWNRSTCFGWYLLPSSGAQTAVSTASGICHTVTLTCRYRGRVGTGLSVQVWMRLRLIQTRTPNGHLCRVTYTRCRTDTINSPDDGHMAARNMYRIEINIHVKELCVKLVIYKDIVRS